MYTGVLTVCLVETGDKITFKANGDDFIDCKTKLDSFVVQLGITATTKARISYKIQMNKTIIL